eukprot:SAG31_NODE_4157_length_3525_cov_1.686515_3_plen_116_part_00
MAVLPGGKIQRFTAKFTPDGVVSEDGAQVRVVLGPGDAALLRFEGEVDASVQLRHLSAIGVDHLLDQAAWRLSVVETSRVPAGREVDEAVACLARDRQRIRQLSRSPLARVLLVA